MPAVLNGLEWQTCLRRIQFLNRFENSALIEAAETDKLVPPTVEVYRGNEAYGFLLEVICGLNSPLLGETAVMGGLTQTSVSISRSGIPILVDLPIVGRLFGVTNRRETKRDLLILITPHIIDAGQQPDGQP